MKNEIKQKAREYYLNEVINGDTCDNKDGWTDCFVSGANYIMSLPLSDRLTAAEKERVREIYNGEKEHVQYQMRQANASMNQMCRSWHNQLKEGSHAKLRLLESIFGKEMFEKE